MTAKEIKRLIDGKTCEAIDGIEEIARKYGFVIVFGASDDTACFRGAIDGEAECYDGGTLAFTSENVISNTDGCLNAIKELEKNGFNIGCLQRQINNITAIYEPDEYEHESLKWAYETRIPHDTFTMLRNSKVFCLGIVFSVNDLK